MINKVLLPKLGHHVSLVHRDRMQKRGVFLKFQLPTTLPTTTLPVDSTGNAAVSCPMDGNDTLGDCGEAMVCFPPETKIRMADGTSKSIENICVLDRVVTAEGEESYVTNTMVRQYDGELIRIIAWGHQHLQCTPEHPILTRRGYVPAKELRAGDWIALPAYKINKTFSIKTNNHLTIDRLHYVAGNKIGKGHHSNNSVLKTKMAKAIDAFPKEIKLTPGFGRIVGLFLAEGSTNQNFVRWTFGSHEKNTLVSDLLCLLREELGVEARAVLREKNKNSIDVTLCGKLWRIFFESLCSKGAAHKTIHADIMSGPSEFLKAVFQGWMDGDAGSTVSRNLAQDMYSIAHAIGLNPVIGFRHPPKNNGVINGREIISRGRWILTLRDEIKPKKKTSQFIGVSWAAKEKKWYAYGCKNGVTKNLGLYEYEKEAGEVAAAWRQKNNIVGNGKNFREGNTVWRCIRRIEGDLYKGNVFNFSVAQAESYVAEGIGVHNCHCDNILTFRQGKGTESVFNLTALEQQYEQVSGGDNGLDENEVVNQIWKVGIAGNTAAIIVDALDIDVTNVLLTQFAIDQFYTVQMAWSVPDAFLQGFNTGTVWPNAGIPDPNNGHYVPLADIGGPSDVANGINLNGFYRLWTWGTWCWVSQSFVNSVQPQCFIAFSPRQFDSVTGLDSKGRHITTQAALWVQCGGNPIPASVINAFPPAPTPVPPPPPSPPTPVPPPPGLFTLTFKSNVPAGTRIMFNTPVEIPTGTYTLTKTNSSVNAVEILLDDKK